MWQSTARQGQCPFICAQCLEVDSGKVRAMPLVPVRDELAGEPGIEAALRLLMKGEEAAEIVDVAFPAVEVPPRREDAFEIRVSGRSCKLEIVMKAVGAVVHGRPFSNKRSR